MKDRVLLVLLLGVVLSAAVSMAWGQDEEAEDQEGPEAAAQPEPEGDEAVADEEEEEEESLLNAGTFSLFRFRGIGPAANSGRVITPASPSSRSSTPGSYSIGCVTMDPNNPQRVWVGTGENNSQRSVSSATASTSPSTAAKSWKNVGLKESEHIGMIAVDPRDSRRRLRRGAGTALALRRRPRPLQDDRRRRDLGAVLHISETPGINEVHIDPRDPDVLYASAYQRRRHVWTLINGGPESGIHKSTDGGATWREINKGLPGGRQGPHRPGHLAGESGRDLRDRRGRAGQGRLLPLDDRGETGRR
jgi:hypothetical protein